MSILQWGGCTCALSLANNFVATWNRKFDIETILILVSDTKTILKLVVWQNNRNATPETTHLTSNHLLRKKVISKKGFFLWYQPFVIVQKTQPFPETCFLGLNDVTANYLWRWGHLSPQLLYWFISITVFLTMCLLVLFCQFYPRLLGLTDVTADYLWRWGLAATWALNFYIDVFLSQSF